MQERVRIPRSARRARKVPADDAAQEATHGRVDGSKRRPRSQRGRANWPFLAFPLSARAEPGEPARAPAPAWLEASAAMWALLVCAVCGGTHATPSASTPGEVHRTIEEIIKSNKVVVFSRSNCKESDEVRAMLEEYGIGYSLVELDLREDGQVIAKQLGHGSFSPKTNPVAKAVGAVSVVPAVFVRGSPVSRGALSQSYKSGELEHWASDDVGERMALLT